MDELERRQVDMLQMELARCYAAIDRFQAHQKDLVEVLEDQRDRLALDVEFKELEKGGW